MPPSRSAGDAKRQRRIHHVDSNAVPCLQVHPIDVDDSCPPVYHTTDLCQPSFRTLWRHLATDRSVCLRGRGLSALSDNALLVFSAPDSGPPLCLSGVLEEGGRFSSPPLPLSWRLAALNFSHRLPPTPPPSPSQSPPTSEFPCDQPLRLGPQIPAPARTIAPSQELTTIIATLRAHHRSFRDLARDVDVSTTTLRGFLSALYSLDVITEAPRPLTDTADPFAFLGLHWSAPPSVIHCTCGRLRRQLADTPDAEAEKRLLKRSFDLLQCPQNRRRLRHSLLPPPVFGEVLTRLRADLCRARDRDAIDSAIDLCRRIIELDPSDENTREVLAELLA